MLLDVRMPGIDGLEVARQLATLPEPPAVIFTTAFDEYAVQAFDSQAVAYLLKPIREEKLRAALAKAGAPHAAAAAAGGQRRARAGAPHRTSACAAATGSSSFPIEEVLLFPRRPEIHHRQARRRAKT